MQRFVCNIANFLLCIHNQSNWDSYNFVLKYVICAVLGWSRILIAAILVVINIYGGWQLGLILLIILFFYNYCVFKALSPIRYFPHLYHQWVASLFSSIKIRVEETYSFGLMGLLIIDAQTKQFLFLPDCNGVCSAVSISLWPHGL